MGSVFKKQQLVGIMSASVIIHFKDIIGTNNMELVLGWAYSLAVIIHFRDQTKNEWRVI
jgi:hypothetical protein